MSGILSDQLFDKGVIKMHISLMVDSILKHFCIPNQKCKCNPWLAVKTTFGYISEFIISAKSNKSNEYFQFQYFHNRIRAESTLHLTYQVWGVSWCWHTLSSHSFPLSLNRQELCAEAQSVSPEELGEDEGETGAAEKRGWEREGRQQPLHLYTLGWSHPWRRQH